MSHQILTDSAAYFFQAETITFYRITRLPTTKYSEKNSMNLKNDIFVPATAGLTESHSPLIREINPL